MSVQVEIPSMGESVSEVILLEWLKGRWRARRAGRAALRIRNRQGQRRATVPSQRRAQTSPANRHYARHRSGSSGNR